MTNDFSGPVRLGVDIGGTATKLALAAGEQILVTRATDHYSRPSLTELAEAVCTTLQGLLAEKGMTVDQIQRACLSVPGPVTLEGVVEIAANMPSLIGQDMGRWLAEALNLDGRPVRVQTDAVSAAVAAYHADPAEGRTLYLSLGTGVGGAVLDNAIPLLVTRGTPGHLGHIDVSGGERDAPSTPGAGRGALEAYIGYQTLKAAGVPLDSDERLSHPAMQRGIAALARGLRIFLAIYRPQRIMLLGGVGLMLRPALPQIDALVREGLTPAAPTEWHLTCAQLDHFAAAVGAARSA